MFPLLRLLVTLAALGLAGSVFAATSAPSKPIRIAILTFSNETTTFLKHDTTIAEFSSPASGEAVLRSTSTTRYPFLDPMIYPEISGLEPLIDANLH